MNQTNIRKNNAKVYYRIYPINTLDDQLVQLDKNEKTLYVRNQQDFVKVKKNTKKATFWKFDTDGVFNHSIQSVIYNNIIEDVLEKISHGYDCVIMGFGQTGSGKTNTLTGLTNLPQDVGILPRLINDLYQWKQELPNNTKIALEMSYMEYGKNVAFDLLKEYPNQVAFPYNMSKIKLRSKEQAFTHLFQGEGRKEFIIRSTDYMSHLYTSVLTFFITIKELDLENPVLITPKIHILDCAGVDNSGNSTCMFKSPFEVGNANTTKTNLEQILLVLCRNKQQNIEVQYRANPVLNHLGKSLNNDSILRFIGHIRLDQKNILITLSLLRFGQLVKGLLMKQKVVNPKINPTLEVNYYKNQLYKLKEQHNLELIISNQVDKTSVDNEREGQIERALTSFLNNEKTIEEFMQVSEITTTLKLFKNIYNNFESEKNNLYKQAYEEAIKESKMSIKLSRQSSKSIAKATSQPTLKSKTSKQSLESVGSRKKEVSEPDVSSRKKSVMSVGSRGDSKKIPSTIIPETVPESQEAWNAYITDPATKFLLIIDNYRNNEEQLQKTYLNYLDQLKQTREMKRIVDIRQKELMNIKLIQETEEGLDCMKSDSQVQLDHCINNLNCAKANYLEQMEKSLACKGHMQIYLNMRQDLKKQLAEDFDQYCLNTFNIVADEDTDHILDNITVDLKTIKDENKDKEPEECAESRQTVDVTGAIEKYKKLMSKETEKKRKYKETHKSLFKH